MARKHLRPAAVVIQEFGIRPLASELGCAPSTVWRWRDDPQGLVPSQYHKQLLDLAVRHGKRLSADDLIHGRPA